MKKYGNKHQIFVILFILLFSSTTYLTIINGKISEPSYQEKGINNGINTGVTIYSLDEGIITQSGSKDLELLLDNYVEVDTKNVPNLLYLDSDLSNNPDKYIILFGHSEEKSLKINNNYVSWNDIVDCSSKYSDKIFLLPTCYSKSVFTYDARARENIIAPFKNEIDYRLSVDYTLLAMSLFLENDDLFSNSLENLLSNRDLINNPKASLGIPLPFQGYYIQPAKGYVSLNDIFLSNYNVDKFMTEATARFAIHAVLELIFGGIPVFPIVNFLWELFLYSLNVQMFIDFFNNVIHRHIFDFCYDEGTTVDYFIIYDFPFNPICGLIYYLSLVSVTKFSLYSPKFNVTPTSYLRERWTVTMTINLQELFTFVILDYDFSFLATEIITWQLLSHQVLYYNTVPKPPYDDVPY